MIIKSFNLNDIKKSNAIFFLIYGENEGQKDEIIKEVFLNNFKGEIIKYEENQILDNNDIFFEACLNESLFENEKIILVNRVTIKIYEIIKKLLDNKVFNKKIILNSNILEKKSKLRKLFEEENKLVCVAVYQDNNASLFKIANNFFKTNNISISSENINFIVDKSSGDRKNLYNEMNKILNFCFSKRKINNEELQKLINENQDENYFELVDNCLAKNYTKVNRIINNSIFNNSESIILIRSFLSRVKRLIELKKLQSQIGSEKDTVNSYRPPIFWKDKEIVEKQIKSWSNDEVYKLLDEVNKLELRHKKVSSLSNNLIYDLILSTSNN